MTQNIILDSSIWISYLYKNNQNHNEARNLINNISKKTQIYIPEMVLIEVIIVLAKSNQLILSKQFLKLNFTIIKLPFFEIAKFIIQYQHLIQSKTNDLLIILHSIIYNIEEFKTFDKKQNNQFLTLKKYVQNKKEEENE